MKKTDATILNMLVFISLSLFKLLNIFKKVFVKMMKKRNHTKISNQHVGLEINIEKNLIKYNKLSNELINKMKLKIYKEKIIVKMVQLFKMLNTT